MVLNLEKLFSLLILLSYEYLIISGSYYYTEILKI